MSEKEYIEREAALRAFGDEPLNWNDTDAELQEVADWKIYRNAIMAIPAADVVKVVRCGECKQYEPEGYPEGAGRCGWIDSVVEKDFYCAAGEKKERNV